MKNQHCSYDEAREKALNAVVSRNPKLAKELGINANVKISSTPQSREEAFLYAQPYDVASVLSNWFNLFTYALFVSHDGWIEHISRNSEGKITYLDIYEAIGSGAKPGNWNSYDRYGYSGKGAYDNWIKNSKYVSIQRYPDYTVAMESYFTSVSTFYGKPYNYNISNRWSTNSSYCSQNIWRGFYTNGVDLDSNRNIPLLYATNHYVAAVLEATGVLPDSIYLSPHLEFVSSG